jgi:hypothetical protein
MSDNRNSYLVGGAQSIPLSISTRLLNDGGKGEASTHMGWMSYVTDELVTLVEQTRAGDVPDVRSK